jgi:hypothetical protein
MDVTCAEGAIDDSFTVTDDSTMAAALCDPEKSEKAPRSTLLMWHMHISFQ